jgi:molybdenum cofactor synthesis domain-containing protein
MDASTKPTAHAHGPSGTSEVPIQVGILTCSDRGAAGERADVSGPTLHNLVIDRLGAIVRQYRVVPDERGPIEGAIREWADEQRLDLILTTGGTGLSARDVTPDATRAACDREIPAIGQAMVLSSLAVTPYAMLTRATAGIRKGTLVVNLPGNPKALAENFEAIAEVLPHAIDIIRGVDTHANTSYGGASYRGHAHAHARQGAGAAPTASATTRAHSHAHASASTTHSDADLGARSGTSPARIARDVGGPPC